MFSMESFLRNLSDLNVRFYEGFQSKSTDRTPTAVYQIIARDTSRFDLQIDTNIPFRFDAYYKHRNQFYRHPYNLRTEIVRTCVVEYHSLTKYEISLYLEVKRLEKFDNDDLKRYYQAIDENIDNDEELHDYHDVYLIFQYEINGQTIQLSCNNARPIHLPKFLSNPWTHLNTLTRFRYDAENRDGMFPCEMKLHHGNLTHLRSYKIVLCLISNTIPARMDSHAIRWLCRLRTEISNSTTSSKQKIDKEKLYNLNHPTGIVIAQVFGPNQTFTPQMLYSNGDLNHVRSYFEPTDFRTKLNNSSNKGTSTLAIALVKTSDYLIHMKTRRQDPYIRRYLPFNEFDNVDDNFEMNDAKILKRLKTQKDHRNQQLILDDNDHENETFSQAHVRLYVAAYDENDILLTEALHPPLRNNKIFEQLHIIRIVQPKYELHAYEPAYVYCNYDYHKSRSDQDLCPYQFELVFTQSTSEPTTEQLLRLFHQPHISIPASFVPNCACLLQFEVPNDPKYDKHRVLLRLRHRQSRDYNPSDVALCDSIPWIYHADTTSVTDLILESDLNRLCDTQKSNSSISSPTIELQLYPNSILSESDDSNHSIRPLHTPEFEAPTQKRFSFSCLTSQQDDVI